MPKVLADLIKAAAALPIESVDLKQLSEIETIIASTTDVEDMEKLQEVESKFETARLSSIQMIDAVNDAQKDASKFLKSKKSEATKKKDEEERKKAEEAAKVREAADLEKA